MSKQLEHDYIGLTEVKAMENCIKPKFSSNNGKVSRLKTELSLGLPGCESQSPEKKSVTGVTIFGRDFEEKPLTGGGYSAGSLKSPSSSSAGAKRGFSDASDNWGFSVLANSDSNNQNSQKLGVSSSSNGVQEKKQPANENGAAAPSAKAQVVGWPPIRSFRKNTLASTSAKNNEQAEEKTTGACLYVKVSMDGAPYLRKVDLQTYKNYMELSSALEKMFSCFIKGQYGTKGHGKQDSLGENQSTDLQNAEFVLTYEDKDGDWMLVGDVPWRMFTENCRKLRVMKGSEAIGLAPDAAEKRKTEA